MGRKQELEAKLLEEVEDLDKLIEQKNEEYDRMVGQGLKESEVAQELRHEIMSMMSRVNKLLRTMGKEDEGYDL